jgi:translation initiation factor 2 alpha subunit (eIF-2alpha)
MAGAVLLAGIALTTTTLRAEPPASIDAACQAIVGNAKVKAALDSIKTDGAATFAEQKRITEIAAPSYKEKVRAEYYLRAECYLKRMHGASPPTLAVRHSPK